jgi:hypothetical protein
MNKPKLTILLALILSASAASSQAQVVSLIGGIGGARLPAGGDFWGDGVRGAAIDASVSVALNDRFALEPFVTYGRRAIPYNDPRVSGGPTQRTEGLWGVVVSQRLRATTREHFHAFITYGASGYYGHDAVPTRNYLINRNQTFTMPARTENEVLPPVFGVIGGGVQRSIAEHLAVRAQIDMLTVLFIPVGVRGSVGVVVPLGRAR